VTSRPPHPTTDRQATPPRLWEPTASLDPPALVPRRARPHLGGRGLPLPRCCAPPGTRATATRARGTGTRPTRRAAPALRHRPAPAWEDGGPTQAGGETFRAVGSPHAMAERRPASGDAPTREETPAQEGQGLLTGGEPLGFSPAPWAPNAGAHLLPEAAARNERRLEAVRFRVKAPVTRRPPHRSGREGFPHPVPR
jgi:hypothetical protein